MIKKAYHHGNLKAAAIEEAVVLSQEFGLMSWSLRELSKYMDVSHVALYKHFSTKNEILYNVAIKGFEGLINKSVNVKSFKEIGEVYIEYAIDNPILFEAMFHPELPPSGNEQLKKISSRYLFIAMSKIENLPEEDTYRIFLKGWAAAHGYAQLSTRNIIQNLNIPKNDIGPKNFIEFLWSE